MATYGELRARLADDFNRTDINSQIGSEIMRAIKHYERTRFWFNEAQAGASLVTSQFNYALSSLSVSDLLVLDTIEVTVSSHRYELDEISWHEYMDNWRGNSSTTGAPTEYTIYADQVFVGPAPASTYSVDVSYVKALTTLSADSDTNDWTTTAEDLIASRAARVIAMRTLRLPQNDVMYFAQLEREALNALLLESDQRLITGHMRYRG